MKSTVKKEENKVFISHSADETNAAIKIKSLLRNSFGKDLEVFISSDYRSIAGGDHWFEKIVDALKSSKVVLVMLSEHSVDRPWINFEAGAGKGAENRVIPVVFRSFSKDRVVAPLSLLQVRDSKIVKDLEGMLIDIGSILAQDPNITDLELFIEELTEIERSLPVSGIDMIPTIHYSGENIYLDFRLENKGNREIQLTEVWATIPDECRDPTSHLPTGSPALRVAHNLDLILPTVTKRQFAGFVVTGPDYFPTFEILPELLIPSQFPYKLPELRLSLKRGFDGEQSVSFGVHGKSNISFQKEIKLKEVEGFRS